MRVDSAFGLVVEFSSNYIIEVEVKKPDRVHVTRSVCWQDPTDYDPRGPFDDGTSGALTRLLPQ